jgi:hypothetical protein
MVIKVNFATVDDSEVDSGGSATPAGTYLCEVKQAEEITYDDGNQVVNYRLIVLEGEHEGRVASFDTLKFHTEKLFQRAKFVLRRMGFPVDDEGWELEAELMNGRRVLATTQPKPTCRECSWEVKPKEKDDEGRLIYKCEKDTCEWQGHDPRAFTKVAWNGYETVEGGAGDAASGDKATETKAKDLPF